MIKSLFIIILIFTANQTIFANTMNSEIDYLLNHISELNGTFVRNGTEHSPKEAVKHIKKKYKHFKDKISSTEQFIELSASKSTFSGKIYFIKINGKTSPSKDYLLKVLKNHRETVNQVPNKSLQQKF